MNDRIVAAQTAAHALTDVEFADFRRWCAIDEQQRRERDKGAREAETTIYQQMRAGGVIPDAPEVWEAPTPPMVVWLPGDTCSHNGASWVQVADVHTAEEPGVGQDWQLVAEEGMAGDGE